MPTTNARADVLKKEGDEHFRAGSFKQALTQYQQATVEDANFKEAWLNQAVCLRKLKLFDEALVKVKQALALDDNYEKAHSLHAAILFEQEQYQTALKIIDLSLIKNKENIELLKLKQRCLAPISAEIFFGIVDLKLTAQNEVKILEFGCGMKSGLSGFDQSHPGEPTLFERFIKYLKMQALPFFLNSSPGIPYTNDREFIDKLKLGTGWKASAKPFDYSDLSSYRGIYGGTDLKAVMNDIVVLDGKNCTSIILDDKHLMQEILFDDSTQAYRPFTQLVSRDRCLTDAQAIQVSFSAYSHCLIKSAEATRGEGVILIPRSKLAQYLRLLGQSTIKEFTTQLVSLGLVDINNPEVKKLVVMYTSPNQRILIESREISKPVLYQGKTYDPTMRVAFVTTRNGGEIKIQFLGAYWKFPPDAVQAGVISEQNVISSFQGSDIRAGKVGIADMAHVYAKLQGVLPKLFKKAWQFDPEPYITHLRTREPKQLFFFLTRLALSLSEQGLHTLAHHYIDEAIKLNPTVCEGHHVKGQIFHGQGKYNEAIACYSKSINIGSESSLLRRGESWHELKNFAARDKDFAEAIKLGVSRDQIANFINAKQHPEQIKTICI